VFWLFAALAGAFQILPGLEYTRHSIRWVGSQNAVFWGQSVPYPVHQQHSLSPMGIVGLALAIGGREFLFVGLVLLTLALAALIEGFQAREARMFGAIG